MTVSSLQVERESKLRYSGMKPIPGNARLIAFHLPQFHPTPENDEWWGKGFTEWTNVAKTKRLFKNHHQPRVPADLGFYDLRLPEVRQAQAELAHSHGIEGFCYWHYWFEGRRMLDLVEREILRTGEPNYPFCLAWANHNWSRSWQGDAKQILIEQKYSDADTVRHAHYLADYFADSRYIHIKGRPLFLIYAPFELPHPERTLEIYRSESVRLGLPEPFIVAVNTRKPLDDARPIGFDMNVDMWPRFLFFEHGETQWRFDRFLRNAAQYGVGDGSLKIYDYESMMNRMADWECSYPHFKSVCVGWDNTPRRGSKGWILANESPEVFERILTRILKQVQPEPWDERLVFINAWNEWGEGMYLEPDQRHGTAFLEAVRRANTLGQNSPSTVETLNGNIV